MDESSFITDQKDIYTHSKAIADQAQSIRNDGEIKL